MKKKNLKIHSENILPIIKEWLYSDRDIFARELVSNACDALKKIKILRDQGETEAKDEEFRIEIKADKEQKTLRFIDSGIGMDAKEVEKYISQIAFSSAEGFLEQYQSNKEEDQFIGHFGLGFYSAYMVAERVEIQTLSHKKGAKPVHWECDGSSEYSIDRGTRATRGTEIILHVGKEGEEFLEVARLKKVLTQYCAFLPYPVFLGDEQMNTHPPLWVKAPSDCSEKEYLEFFRHLYPMQPDPLFWVHLNVDYPFHLKGILYFPKMQRDFDPEKSSVHLYCNRVFVSDQCKDVIPHYLTMLKGVIDSPDIPLNVSRSSLQMDKTVRQLSKHISKKVSDALQTLHRTDREKFERCWPDVSTVVKLGVLEDEKFYERVKEILLWKQADGTYTTAEDYLERNGEKTDRKVFYAKDQNHLSQFLKVYEEQQIDVLLLGEAIDSYVVQHLERKLSPAKFQRIDASVGSHLLDPTKEKNVLDEHGKTEAAHVADLLRSHIGSENLEIEAKSLKGDSVPGFVVIDEEQRRMRDYMVAMNPTGSDAMEEFGKKTFVANTNNRLIQALPAIQKKNPTLAKELAQEIYDLSLLSQKELHPKQLGPFIERSTQVLEKLATSLE